MQVPERSGGEILGGDGVEKDYFDDEVFRSCFSV